MKDWTPAEWAIFLPLLAGQIILIVQTLRRNKQRKIEEKVLDEKLKDIKQTVVENVEEVKQTVVKKAEDIKQTVVENGTHKKE